MYDQDKSSGFDRREGKEKWGWYYVDGKKVFYISAKLPPRGRDVSPGRINALRNQMKLNREQFDQLCDCPMTGPDYHALIVAKIKQGLL
jgi:hypothetical protein